MTTVPDLSLQAQTLLAAGERVVSTDEMTGIQALERTPPTIPRGPGRVERREFAYIRQGTLTSSPISMWPKATLWPRLWG